MDFDLPHHHDDPEKLAQLARCLQKTEDFQRVSDVFRQLSDPTRIRVFWLLCHCEECVLDISAILSMSSPAVSHHLRQLRESGLILSRRRGKEVYYRAASSEQAALLHHMIERTMTISCPKDEPISAAPHLPALDAQQAAPGDYPAEHLATIRQVHDLLTEDLSQRLTIDDLSARFLMNPTTMKTLFRAVYGNSIAAHVREHRMESAASQLRETDEPIAEVARRVGYESQSRFSAEFKRQFGLLPTEYRRRYRAV